MKIKKLAVAAMGMAFAWQIAGGDVLAQGYPDKTIRIISPYSAGGPSDAIARPIAEELSKRLGQTVVVENNPGAGGMIGANLVAQAAPDGYTLLLSFSTIMTSGWLLQKERHFDPLDSFDHIAKLAVGSAVLAARADFPVDDFSEFLADAKENPPATMGILGVGSGAHLASELLKLRTGVEVIYVPYPGATPMVTDILGGRLDLAILNPGPVDQHIKSKAMKGLAVLSMERLDSIPDVPTIDESVEGFSYESWYGLAAPAGTPEPILQRLHEAVSEILKDDKIADQVQKGAGLSLAEVETPEGFEADIATSIEQWSEVIEKAGIEPQ